MRVAQDQAAVYQNADPQAILTVLMHKIARTAEVEGMEEAHTLLQDWLVLACGAYNAHRAAQPGGSHVSPESPLPGPQSTGAPACTTTTTQ